MAWVELGVATDEESFTPLVRVRLIADGGILVDASRSAPFRDWRYGVFGVPAGTGPHPEMPPIPEALVKLEPPAPVLHYHRSGMVSLNRTGSPYPRRLEHTTALGQLVGREGRATHVFTANFNEPLAFKARGRKPTDFVIQDDAKPIAAVSVIAYVNQTANLPEPPPDHPVESAVTGPDGRTFPGVTLRVERGPSRHDPDPLDIVVHLAVDLNRDVDFNDAGQSTLVIAGWSFEQMVDHLDEAAKMLALWGATRFPDETAVSSDA